MRSVHARGRLRLGLAFGLVGMLVAACGDDGGSSTTSTPATAASTTTAEVTTTAASTTTAQPTTTAVPPTTPAPTTSATIPPTTIAPTTTSTTIPPTTAAPTLTDVKVYFLRNERLVIAHRQVAAPAVLRGALTALLAGPRPGERADGLGTTIPSGTTLLDLNLADGLATVDLSSEFDDGGGTLSMTTRVAEVVFTATQFPNVDRVVFWMNGEPIETLGGEGLILDEPQTRAMVSRVISGAVIFDTPAYGSSVTSPFTVTGEGDVYEGQFPIEIWRDGVQIGGVAPVTAGAWGQWAEFEVAISVDAPPGPIELVGYDPGGCGDEPECPEIVKTVVPLVLTG